MIFTVSSVSFPNRRPFPHRLPWVRGVSLRSGSAPGRPQTGATGGYGGHRQQLRHDLRLWVRLYFLTSRARWWIYITSPQILLFKGWIRLSLLCAGAERIIHPDIFSVEFWLRDLSGFHRHEERVWRWSLTWMCFWGSVAHSSDLWMDKQSLQLCWGLWFDKFVTNVWFSRQV